MDKMGLDKKSPTSLDDKLKEIIAYKLMQISRMLGYVTVYKTTRDYMYFGWKLADGNVRIYDLLQNECFIENAEKLKIKYSITKKDITFTKM